MVVGTAALLVAALPANEALAQSQSDDSRTSEANEDTVKTKMGTTFRGKIVSEDGEKIVIETRSGPVTIPRAVVQEVRKAEIDYRSASEKIEAPEIRPEDAPKHIEEARKLAGKGEMTRAAALCEGLLNLPGGTLSNEQRETIGKTMAEAYFELKDWPAAARGLRKAAVAINVETDRDRLLAVAEAFEAHKPPTIGGQTVENFSQAQQAAMKWKAGEIFNYAKQYVDEMGEINRRSNVDRALEVAQIRLAKSETYMPGYSIIRSPELVKVMVERLMDAVGKAEKQLVERRKELMRGYVGHVTSRKYAEAWNKDCYVYLDIIDGAAGCLNNVTYLGERFSETKDLYDTKAHEEHKKTVYGLQFYDEDIIMSGGRKIALKGNKIAPAKIGGS
ncbi:MAG: hypothetical protein JXL80_03595 [Planctomycetes bacterium]|nr:hypothetical protein [Planctomycetota bacterium]